MRIALFVRTFPSLSQTFVLNQITGLIDRGYAEVDIYASTSDNTSLVHPDIEKYNLLNRTHYWPRIPRRKILRLLKGLWLLLTSCYRDPIRLLRSLNVFHYGKQALSMKLLYLVYPLLGKQSYDIIHCHFGPNGLKAAFLRNVGVLEGKLITTFHGYDIASPPQQSGGCAYAQLFETGDLFLPISERWRHRLIELGCHEKKILVHRMGIDCKRFSFALHQLRAGRRVQLVTIARLVEKKGVEYGIRAIAKLVKVNQNIEYHVVGDGPLRKDLQRLIRELDVGDTVKLLGWKQQQEIIKILNNTDILLLPSVTSKDGDQEGIPVVLMEAMAMGLPVVSTQHSGIPELIENGVSGFLVPERDVDILSAKLGYLVEHPEVWPKMGQAGRAHVEEHLDNNKLNDQLVEIYQQLLS